MPSRARLMLFSACPKAVRERFPPALHLFAADLENEFKLREPNFRMTAQRDAPGGYGDLPAGRSSRLIDKLVGVPNGVVAMSVFAVPEAGRETSTNLASGQVRGENDIVVTSCSARRWRARRHVIQWSVGLLAGPLRARPLRRLSGMVARSPIRTCWP